MPATSEKAKEKLKHNQRTYSLTPRGKWAAQKAHAKKRGHDFLLTFEDWWKIWEESGKYHLRGKNVGQYCMARKNDQGAYIVGNIDIVEVHTNLGEQLISGKHITRKLTKVKILDIIKEYNTGKATSSIAKKFGISQPYVSKLAKGIRGKLILSME